MKNLFVLLFALCSFQMLAQTGIGTSTPNVSAKLDVYSDNKGFLPPRVTLTSVTDNTTIPTPAEGLLVYNKGTVGLQAGYYYWNGANWATIATATSAGNGVTASDMVKVYDGIGNATINTNGATFSVTTSGKYSFDFTTSAFSTIGIFTINFQVRDGANSNSVIGSDLQTSYNNNVRVEYNGKVEVNLIAGRSYNVLISATSGTINSGDYCRVYMKQVAGNLPVTGQTVDYVHVQNQVSQTVVTGDNIKFNTKVAGNIPYDPSTGYFSLSANKTYRLNGFVTLDGGSGGGNELTTVWKTTSGTSLSSAALLFSGNINSSAGGQGVSDVIYTPTTNTTVVLNVGWAGGTSPVITRAGFVSATIEQIGSSAIINPWILSGNNSYNTTGNVGIGTNAPTTKLDVTGDVNVTGNLNVTAGAASANIAANALLIGNSTGDEGGEIQLAKAATNTTLGNKIILDVYQNKLRLWEGGANSKGVNIDLSKAPDGVGGELVWKKSGFVNAGTFLSLDNLSVTVGDGNVSSRSIVFRAVNSNFTANISSWIGYTGGGGGTAQHDVSITTSNVSSFNGWAFGGEGDGAQYNILDKTNNRFYRIIMMIGSGYINNFFSIERLY